MVSTRLHWWEWASTCELNRSIERRKRQNTWPPDLSRRIVCLLLYEVRLGHSLPLRETFLYPTFITVRCLNANLLSKGISSDDWNLAREFTYFLSSIEVGIRVKFQFWWFTLTGFGWTNNPPGDNYESIRTDKQWVSERERERERERVKTLGERKALYNDESLPVNLFDQDNDICSYIVNEVTCKSDSCSGFIYEYAITRCL